MNVRLASLWAIVAVFVVGLGMNAHAQPVFENKTPVGFSPSDSTTKVNFVTDEDVYVRVDLNEAANADFPVIVNYQNIERAVPFFSTAGTAAYLSQAVTIDDNGVIHRAWVQQRGTGPTAGTPIYGVVYSKSFDGGKTFSDTVAVSGTLRFDMITPNLTVTGAFSTVDIVVDSRGNPRVVYALDNSPDGIHASNTAQTAVRGASTLREFNNIFFNYSNDGGSSWLPANGAVVVNDTNTVGKVGVGSVFATSAGTYQGRKVAFPRMAITSTDDIFIVYERDHRADSVPLLATALEPDIMLAKMDADSLLLGNAQAVRIGSQGTVDSRGGVRIDPDATRNTGPDIAIGDDDVLHIVYYDNTNDQLEHKTLPAALWTDVSSFGWNQTARGAIVGTFDDETATNAGMNSGSAGDDHIGAGGFVHLFPTVAVDKARTPDRIYAFWKFTDGTTNDENVAFNFYTYDGQTGAPGGAATTTVWGTQSNAFPTGSGLYNVNGNPLFQSDTRYQVENHWNFTDRVAAVVDDRKGTSGDVHIVFSGGPSVKGSGLSVFANNVYYTRFNGTEWELPQVVVSAATSTADGLPLAKANVLFDPDITMNSGDDNVYLTFVGGSSDASSVTNFDGVTVGPTPGRGYATQNDGVINPLAFFKIIARRTTFSDISVPSGANVYQTVYNPVNPQTGGLPQSKQLIAVTVADNQDGSGIGFSTPGASKAPGGFLTGQWRRLAGGSLGITSLNPGDTGSIFKGAISQIQAQNDNGVFEGKIDDDGSLGFAEWGDDGDKVGLLVKLNVLASDSGSNLAVILASTAAKGVRDAGAVLQADSSSQSLSVAFSGFTSPNTHTFVRGITSEATSSGLTAPMGSYFQLGANISIVAANNAPVVNVVEPDASSSSAGFANEKSRIRYVLFDQDSDVTPVSPATDTLKFELFAYPDNGLGTVRDIRTFGTLIVDENDALSTPRISGNPVGTLDFLEGSSSSNVQDYTWDDPGVTLQNAYGWAPITKMLDGTFFIYIVAEDGVNPPVFDVSSGPVRIRHIPLVKSISPVASDTVDTGEQFGNNTNPFTINFQLVDFDDDAQVRLFISTNAGLADSNVVVTGTFPNLSLDLNGATPIQLSDTLRTDEDVSFDFDVTAQGSNKDSVIAQGNYTIYAVVADEDTFALGTSTFPLAVRHSPSFEFTAPLLGTVQKLNTTQQFQYTIEWQRGRSDQDLDDNANISLYYIGKDPASLNFSGTDSTALIDSGAVLITGNIKEDDEGGGDQFVWSFRNPPSALPKTFRPKFSAGVYNVHQYQQGATTDTAWVYAVLSDSRGNTRVQVGGAVLLLGSQENPASPSPRVTMQTPPPGGQLLINGDVVRLSWDAFLIDDGTGTDDAYLRLYAAPKGSASTLTDLESNNVADGGQVILINSLTGRDDVATNIRTLRESGPNFFLWDTKTTSFKISGTPTEFDIFIAASMDPNFQKQVHVNGVVDSVASGLGSDAQKAVLSKSPGVLRVEGTDPLFSIELSPGAMTAASGDTLDLDVFINSQGSSVNLMGLFLDVPRTFFDVVDQDTVQAGLQPFADSTGAFISPSTIAQNDTTPGTAQFIKLNFVESVINGEVIGRVASPFDSSQVAARMQLVTKPFSGGAPLDTLLVWSSEPNRKTGLFNGTTEMATSPRNATVTLTPRARLFVTVPLQGREGDFGDTLDVHLRPIGSTQDLTDQTYIKANDVTPVVSGGSTATPILEDSVQVVSDVFGSFSLTEIPTGLFEMTVKAPGYVTGRSDTLNLFSGTSLSIQPTFGSDNMGALSPATALNALRGGDATGDNQIDIDDANLVFSLWNKTPADSGFVRDSDINNDGVINQTDLGFVTTNFGNAGFGAPPVFKLKVGGDNSVAEAEVVGLEEVDSWWPGRVFEVKAKVKNMADVTAFGLRLVYDPERVKPLPGAQAFSEGDVFADSPRGALFFHRVLQGAIDVTGGRIGAGWSASGDAELVTVRFMALTDDPGRIEISSGGLVNSRFHEEVLRAPKAQVLPKVAALHQNYPNPFNPSTEIRFDIPTARDVKVKIYNQLGQTIKTLVDQRMKAGRYSLTWDGTTSRGHSVASGVYFYSLKAGKFSQVRKMTLLK